MSASPQIRLTGEAEWQSAARRLATDEATLVSLWGDEGRMRMALREADGALALVDVACQGGAFPSVAALHAPASRLERAACDLFGFTATGAPDARRWLDHGRWPLRHPLGDEAEPHDGAADAYVFLGAKGPGLHQIPVGPVHAGIIEPGHFRFHAGGEAVVRLEERLGYKHKGVDALMRGASLERAAILAARVSGDSTVAYGVAFARAVEAASGVEAPPRAQMLRGVMAELERLANHFGDIGAICNDAAFALMHAHCGILRERTLRAAKTAFGHRLMMDAVAPGGCSVDLAPEGADAIRAHVRGIRATFPKLVQLYDNTASLQDRTVGTGVLRAELARRYGAGGVIGRASGRDFDARRSHPYPPYDNLSFKVPTRREGDVNARIWVRIDEVFESLDLVETMLALIPRGPVRAALPPSGGHREGSALVEAFRGDVFAHVRLTDDGSMARCHLRDASWFQWPLLEAAIEGNIVADFPLCNKSFNCSYSGCDL
jgi:Ni,Fe-hydrogenase III large subunit